jgi:hypothetical protein
MSTLTFFFPFYFTLAALFLTAIETTLFPNLGIPSLYAPDMTLALITFLASCSLGWRSIFAAVGVAFTAPLSNNSPSILQPMMTLFIFFIGNRLNQTVFMNNIFPQAFFTGSAKFLMAVSLPLLVSPSPPLGQTIQTAFICALTTALFAFPILSYLNSLQEHFQSSTGSITS